MLYHQISCSWTHRLHPRLCVGLGRSKLCKRCHFHWLCIPHVVTEHRKVISSTLHTRHPRTYISHLPRTNAECSVVSRKILARVAYDVVHTTCPFGASTTTRVTRSRSSKQPAVSGSGGAGAEPSDNAATKRGGSSRSNAVTRAAGGAGTGRRGTGAARTRSTQMQTRSRRTRRS